MVPARDQGQRVLLVEGLRELRGLKDGLGTISYAQTLERLKSWRRLFLRVDFGEAKSIEELDMFVAEYRAMRELLQWRIDGLQQPAQRQIALLKQKKMTRELEEGDLKEVVAALGKEVSEKTYEYEDKDSYLKDLEFLVTREYVKLKYGEESREYSQYAVALQRLRELQEKSAAALQQQRARMEEKRALLVKGGV